LILEAGLILCCGEALIDFVPLEDARGYQPCPGGSIYNIAVGLGRLEASVGFLGRISTDFFGDLLVNYMAENGVSSEFTLRADGPTTLAFVSLPDGRHTEPRYVFYANEAVDRTLSPGDLPAALPEKVQALHFGSISLVLEPGASSFEGLMQRESGKRILSLDPNIRPSLIPDREAYRRRFEDWLRFLDIIKLSLADLEWLYPGGDARQIIQTWLGWGPSLCLLTLGAQGANGYTLEGIEAGVPTPKITVSDTVGAGDTFLAASLNWLYENGKLRNKQDLRFLDANQLKACLEYATRAAAINCSRPGANPPYRYEMEKQR
jgi:fructokinase